MTTSFISTNRTLAYIADRDYTGKAAEYRAASELLLRGHNPMFLSVDRGVDLILTSGLHLQVKSSHRHKISSDSGQYAWRMTHHVYTRWGRGNEARSSHQPHYYLLWAIDDDDWYVVPSADTLGRGVLTKVPGTDGFMEKYKARWDFLGEPA